MKKFIIPTFKTRKLMKTNFVNLKNSISAIGTTALNHLESGELKRKFLTKFCFFYLSSSNLWFLLSSNKIYPLKKKNNFFLFKYLKMRKLTNNIINSIKNSSNNKNRNFSKSICHISLALLSFNLTNLKSNFKKFQYSTTSSRWFIYNLNKRICPLKIKFLFFKRIKLKKIISTKFFFKIIYGTPLFFCKAEKFKLSFANFKIVSNKFKLITFRFNNLNQKINFFSIRKTHENFLQSYFILGKNLLNYQLKLSQIPFLNRQINHFLEFLFTKIYFLTNKQNFSLKENLFMDLQNFLINYYLAKVNKKNNFYNLSFFQLLKFNIKEKFIFLKISKSILFNYHFYHNVVVMYMVYYKLKNLNHKNFFFSPLFFNSKKKSIQSFNGLNRLLFNKLFSWLKTSHLNNSNSEILTKYWFFLYESDLNPTLTIQLNKKIDYFCLKRIIKSKKKQKILNLKKDLFLTSLSIFNKLPNQLRFNQSLIGPPLLPIFLCKTEKSKLNKAKFEIPWGKNAVPLFNNFIIISVYKKLKKKTFPISINFWVKKIKKSNNVPPGKPQGGAGGVPVPQGGKNIKFLNLHSSLKKYTLQTWYLKKYRNKKIQLKSHLNKFVFKTCSNEFNHFLSLFFFLKVPQVENDRVPHERLERNYYLNKTYKKIQSNLLINKSYFKQVLKNSISPSNINFVLINGIENLNF